MQFNYGDGNKFHIHLKLGIKKYPRKEACKHRLTISCRSLELLKSGEGGSIAAWAIALNQHLRTLSIATNNPFLNEARPWFPEN